MTVTTAISKYMGNAVKLADIWGTLIYNVMAPPYLAKGDGTAVDSASINAAIDDCSANGGGIVFFPAGKYIIDASIVKKSKVSLIGSGSMTSEIRWNLSSGGVIIDTSNQSLIGTVIQGLKLTKSNTVTGNVTGILGGASLTNYNAMNVAIRDMRITALTNGIIGNADPTGVGIFDSIIENCWIESCDVGLNSCGSQMTLLHNKFYDNIKAIVIEGLNNTTIGSINQFGGIFISNGWDYYIASDCRPCYISGTWHEGSTNGILTIENANTKLLSMKFENCMLSTKATHPTPIMNFSNASSKSSIVIDNCTVYPTANGDAFVIQRPTPFAAAFTIRDSIQQNYDATVVTLNNSASISNSRTKIGTGTAIFNNMAVGQWTNQVISLTSVPFTSAPLIFLSVNGATKIYTDSANVSSSQFTLNANNADTIITSVTVNWLAIGS